MYYISLQINQSLQDTIVRFYAAPRQSTGSAFAADNAFTTKSTYSLVVLLVAIRSVSTSVPICDARLLVAFLPPSMTGRRPG